MREALIQCRTLAVACAEAPAWSLSDGAVVDALRAVHQLEQTIAAAKLHLVRQVDVRGIPAAQHHRTCASWLREQLRVGAGTARRLVETARALDTRPGLDEALTGGVINAEQATVVVETMTAMPREAGPEVIDKAETMMIDWAGEFDPHAMRRLGTRILAHVAPDLADRVDAALARAETRAYAGRTFTLSPAGDGRVRLSGYLDTEAAAIVTAALDPLCAPHRAGTSPPHPAPDDRTTTGPSTTGPSTTGPSTTGPSTTGPAAGGPGGRDVSVGPADERSPGQRRADALVDICRLALHAGELPTSGGEPPQVTLTIDLEALRRQLGTGTLDTGDHLTPAQVRRLACDARLIPAVLDTAGHVLDLGRSRRLVTGALRRALVLRDHGCAFPGCDRAPRWTDAHHIVHWADGGPTTLANSVLLCRRHHRVIHHGDWQVRPAPDGRPEFLPPAHLDPHRRPRRNAYHLRR